VPVGRTVFPGIHARHLPESLPITRLLHRLPRHNDSDADSLAMSLKLNSGIVKCRADCVHAFGCRREFVVLKVADRFERQAGRFAQLVLSPAQKCTGGYGLFDSEGLHIGTIADFQQISTADCRLIPLTPAGLPDQRSYKGCKLWARRAVLVCGPDSLGNSTGDKCERANPSDANSPHGFVGLDQPARGCDRRLDQGSDAVVRPIATATPPIASLPRGPHSR
jgi:hypothetical protein